MRGNRKVRIVSGRISYASNNIYGIVDLLNHRLSDWIRSLIMKL